MTNEQKKMVVGDFEKFMQHILHQGNEFTLEMFIKFGTSLVNFYTGSQLITSIDRKPTGLLLVTCFNKGIGNRISDKDLDEISDFIISDSSLDYSILNPIFGHS